MTREQYILSLSPGDDITSQAMRRILEEAISGWEEQLSIQGRLLPEPDIASDALNVSHDD